MLRQKRKAPTHTVLIRMLDGRDTEHTIQRSDTPEAIILNIVTTLNIPDRTVFGLAYSWNESREETNKSSLGLGSWVWLNNHKPLLKQLSDLPDGASDSTFTVYFRFKFYPRPPIATTVQDDKIRHLLRLQIEQDFRDGRLDCSFHMRAYMDAYLMQAELGNYDARLHNSLDYVRVIRSLDVRFDGVEMLQWIASYHSELDGVTSSEAETKYLSLATRLPYYGVTSFPVSSISGQQLTLNISMDGIFTSSNTARPQQYFWLQIISLSYRRRRFRLEVQPQDPDESMRIRSSIIEYKCNSERAAKLIWLTSMDFHMYYRPKALGAGNVTSSSSASGSPQNLTGARRLLNRTASLRRSLSARRHHYSTGHVLRSEQRSQSDSLSLEESGINVGVSSTGQSNEMWRRFSEPTGPQQPSTSMGTSAAGRLHHSTDSMRIFGEGSGDGTTASSTPATGHKPLIPPCEMCGWSSAWTRGVSPQLYNEDSLSLLPRKCEFRIIRLGAAKVGWSVEMETYWCMPMIGFTSSGRRLYSITEDGREFLLEGWSVREGDRLICSLDVRRRFASWYLNDVLLESRSDLPTALTRSEAQPAVWDLEADLEIRLSRGNNGPALSLLIKAPNVTANRMEGSAIVGSGSRQVQASRASSATSSDSPLERGANVLPNSRLSSVEHEEVGQSTPDETDLRRSDRNLSRETGLKTVSNNTEEEADERGTQETDEYEKEAAIGGGDEYQRNGIKDNSDGLDEGVIKTFLTVSTIPFVQTHTTRIPSAFNGISQNPVENPSTKIPFVKTRRCIFQG